MLMRPIERSAFSSFVVRYGVGSRLLKTGVSTFALASGKCLQFLTALVSVPLALNYLGKADYGLLLTVTSLAAWLGIADAGIGLGVKNCLIGALSRNDRKAARNYVSTGVLSLSTVALIAAIGFAVSFASVPWTKILPVQIEQHEKLRSTIFATVLMVLFGLPLNMIRQIYSAEIKEHKNVVWTVFGSVASLIVLIAAVRLDLGIVGVALAMYATPLAASVACGIYLFTTDKPWLRPSWRCLNRSAGREIWATGSMFLLIQIAMLGIYQMSAIIISRSAGVLHVPDYSIPATLFSYVSLLVSFMVSPFWAGFGEAAASGDWDWIATNLARLRKASFWLAGTLSLGLVIVGPAIVSRLSTGTVVPSRVLLIFLAVYTIVGATLSPYSMLLNGLRRVGLHAAFAILHASINVGLAVILVGPYGVVGVAAASLVSILSTSTWILPLAGHRLLSSSARAAYSLANRKR